MTHSSPPTTRLGPWRPPLASWRSPPRSRTCPLFAPRPDLRPLTRPPRSGEKLTKKVLKLVKKAAKAKCVFRGVKEVTKAMRTGKTG